MQKFITDRLPEIEDLCRKHHVQRLSIFGSAVRDDFNPVTSDVDVRVVFDSPKIERYARNAFVFQDSLITLLGRQVDMVSGKLLRNERLADRVAQTEVLLYGA